MAWARIDDGFHDHPKVDDLSLAAVGLWTVCLTWAHRHRKTAVVAGHITEARARKAAGKQADALVAELVGARLWDVEQHIGGWVIHDFADYLPKQRDPDERREAGRKGAANRWQGRGKADGNLPDEGMATDSSRASAPASPSRPVPSEGSSVEGERPETLRAVAASQPPNKPTSSCTRHPYGNPGNEACGGCKRDAEQKTREADRLAEKQRLIDEETARNCPDCEGTHKVLDPATKLPTRKTCEHRNARRAAS